VDFDTGTEIGYFENEGTIVDSFRILESKRGYYYSKTKEFEFIGQVQSDTKDYVLLSDSMTYNTNTKVFTFHSNTHIWSENGYLSCHKGWYDSDKNIMSFYSKSYILSDRQEIFADSIYYESNRKKGRMYSNVQIIDTVQKTIALADFADFDMNAENFLIRKNPSIVMYDGNDSVFIRADTLYSVTQTVKIPVSKSDSTHLTSDTVPDSGAPERLSKIPLRNSGFAAPGPDSGAPARLSKPPLRNTGFAAPDPDSINPRLTPDTVPDKIILPDSTFATPVQDSIALLISDTLTDKIILPDSAFAASVPDSITPARLTPDTLPDIAFARPVPDSIAADTTGYAPDTTEYADSTYKEIFAVRNARLYRSDFQLKGDSMYFNTVDSVWRVYYDPILWNGKKMQIISDSMKFFIVNGDLDHADFNGNAMVVVPEGNPDSTAYFNQIKSRNMKALLKNRSLNRFEATGNVQTIAFSLNNYTMNKAESASFRIDFESGRARRIAYYEQVTGKNDSFVHIREDEIRLPGYRWEPDLRPKSGDEIISRLLRPSERTARESLPRPSFPITKRIDEIESGIKN
jgi:lipopolysaccharide export system protein LptA